MRGHVMDEQTTWGWLSDPNNRETVALLGGGLIAVISAGWAVFVFLRRNKNGSASSVRTTADQGIGIVGGNAVIGIGGAQLPAIIEAATKGLQTLTSEQKQTIDALEQRLGVSEGAVLALFRTLGEANVPPEQWEERLVEIASDYKRVQEELTADPNDSTETAKLKNEVIAALKAGEPEHADALLKQILEAEDKALEQGRLDAAATSAQRGDLALARLRYREAAAHFADAAKRTPITYKKVISGYLHQKADALYRQGHEFGDNEALAHAIDLCKAMLTRISRKSTPLDWARTQNKLGNALRSLGERDSSAGRLEEAVTAYREALKELTREREALDWAAIQNNLGNALGRLGARESGTARLEKAVAAYREALKERTRERVPLDWAMTQNNLGNVLGNLGERENNTARLEEAITAYRQALKEWTREGVPLDWAGTQNNLGSALARLGMQESGTARLEEAVAACREALKERTRERLPLDWAMSQSNLGNVLQSLGARESDTARLEEAVTAYREALKEYTRERVPLDWGMTQNNLGNALGELGERESGTARLEEAAAAYREALDVFETAKASRYVLLTRENLEHVQALLMQRRSS